jgi:hydroxymethylpyrimidine/phosphomethylpyrimidine kinase
VKTGMLGTGANAAALAERLQRRDLARLPLVVDPVLAAEAAVPEYEPGSWGPKEAVGLVPEGWFG